MRGVDATTGRALEGDAHLAQSIGDILTTPIGTRLGRRDYGSALFELVDAPFNALTRLRMFAAVADALRRWEPRIRLSRVAIAKVGAALFELTVEVTRLDQSGPNSLTRLTMPLRFARG